MATNEYIHTKVEPLSVNHSIAYAITIFESRKFEYLAVLDGNKFVGCLPYESIINETDLTQTVGDFSIDIEYFFVREYSDMIDAFRIFSLYQSNYSPILNDDLEYVGYIQESDLMIHFSKSPTVKEIGGILVIKKSIRTYSIAEIAQIVELESAKILGIWTSDFVGDDIVLTLKINRTRLGSIEASLERYDYTIVNSYHENTNAVDLEDRYQSFLNYLNI
ncbi:MAG: hypothetical protein KAG96_02315 [Ichthyobacteriaceae bacterium]|nr:hypothetical protein [Ichthyobacteriaceae bacterium]